MNRLEKLRSVVALAKELGVINELGTFITLADEIVEYEEQKCFSWNDWLEHWEQTEIDNSEIFVNNRCNKMRKLAEKLEITPPDYSSR